MAAQLLRGALNHLPTTVIYRDVPLVSLPSSTCPALGPLPPSSGSATAGLSPLLLDKEYF